jgi:uncharacterized protein YbjT (DUF2867 family)
VIHVPAPPSGGVARLVAALRARGAEITDQVAPEPGVGATLLLTTPVDWLHLSMWLAHWHVARSCRLLVLSRVGAHPDAVAPSLQDLWRLEEHARVSLIPTLVLRLAPLVAADSPFWLRLRHARLGPEGRAVVMPVVEEDALKGLESALRETNGRWEGWFEVTGPEARTVAEWAEVAARRGSSSAEVWEPDAAELLEHRLSEPELWQRRFGVFARSVTTWAAEK